MTTLRDPNSHHGAAVNDFGQLLVESVTSTEDRHINLEHQKVWSLPFRGIDPVGAGDIFFYFKNNDTIDYMFTDFRGSTTVAGYLDIIAVSGTPTFTAGTDITPVNRYIGNSNSPTATIKTDTDTTGLTDEGILFSMDVTTVATLQHLKTSAGVIVPPGQSIALRWSAATGILSGVLSIVALV